jgi:hypothetical protein
MKTKLRLTSLKFLAALIALNGRGMGAISRPKIWQAHY